MEHRKSAHLDLRISPQQRDTLKQLAAAAHLSLSAFVLSKCLPVVHTPPQPPKTTTKTPPKPQKPTLQLCPRCARLGAPSCYDCRDASFQARPPQ